MPLCAFLVYTLSDVDMECTIHGLNVKRMSYFIRGVFTNHILLERKVSELGCSMHQDGREVMKVQ